MGGQQLPDILNLDPIVESETLKAEGPGRSFVFIGRGWGHGVGMSEAGAIYMAENGAGYAGILAYFYPGAALSAP